MPFVHRTIDAESAHRLAIKVAKFGLVPQFSNDQAKFPVLVLVYCLLFKLQDLFFYSKQLYGDSNLIIQLD